MDKNNIGQSELISFGSFTGGELIVHDGHDKGTYNTKNKILNINLVNILHSVAPFTGSRLSLVYYTVDHNIILPPPSVHVNDDGKYIFFRGNVNKSTNV